MFRQSDIGRYVFYLAFKGAKLELGRIKRISDDHHAWIVYNCNNEWDKYEEYTGCRTCFDQIIFKED